MSKAGFDYYKQVMATLDKQVAKLQSEFKRHLSCKKGCSFCCENVNFKISYIEALHLAKGFSSLPRPKQQRVIANLESDSTDCPFLVEGCCSAYQFRPVLCRSYGLLIQVGETLGTCSLNFNTPLKQGESLKKLDLLPYYSLLEELSAPLWAKSEGLEASEQAAPKLSIRDFMQMLLLRKS